MPLRPLVPFASALALSLALGGCLPAAVPGALVGAAALYCTTTSEAGKTLARDALTGGVPLIACPGAGAGADPAATQDPGAAASSSTSR